MLRFWVPQKTTKEERAKEGPPSNNFSTPTATWMLLLENLSFYCKGIFRSG